VSSSYSNTLTGALGEYTSLKTLPAIFSVAFVLTSLYQFGGITEITLTWLGNYSLTAEHAALGGILVYAAAFMSSETKSFEHYEQWEQVSLALVPTVTLGYQYVGQVTDFINGLGGTGSAIGAQLAFGLTLFGWFVAVR
jgi:hypothetical protein